MKCGQNCGLAWEVYDLAAATVGDVATNRYRVALQLQRVARTGALALALRVVDGVSGALRQANDRADGYSVAYEQTLPARERQVEYLSLDWKGDARGEYTLRVTVTDLTNNRSTVRETKLRIR